MMTEQRNFQDRTILVTGAAGRLGRRLVRRLVRFPVRELIVGLHRECDRAKLDAMWARGNTGVPQIRYLAIDLATSKADRLNLEPVDLVFHLAGLATAGDPSLRAVDYFEVNCLGTARLLEACAGQGTKVVFASTTHVYGEVAGDRVAEEHATDPLSSYAASKLAAETVVRDYSREFGMPAAILRFSNLYGPDSGENTVVGRALAQCVRREPIHLRSLSPVRDFLHVDDAVEAMLRVGGKLDGENGGITSILNVAGGRGVSIGTMARTLSACARDLGVPGEVVEPGDGKEEGEERCLFNIAKFRAFSGWVPAIELEEGLRSSLLERLERRC